MKIQILIALLLLPVQLNFQLYGMGRMMFLFLILPFIKGSRLSHTVWNMIRARNTPAGLLLSIIIRLLKPLGIVMIGNKRNGGEILGSQIRKFRLVLNEYRLILELGVINEDIFVLHQTVYIRKMLMNKLSTIPT